MKIIDIPTSRQSRKTAAHFDELAEVLKTLPKGKAIQLAGGLSERGNLHKSMKIRGVTIQTMMVDEKEFCVYVAHES